MVLKLLPLAILAFLQTICTDAKVIELEFERRELIPPDTFEKIKRRGAPSAPLFNAQGDLLYLVNVTVGTPPQALSLQLDTGSSDIWLPSAQSSACALSHRCLEGSYDSASSNSYTLLDQSTFLISYVDGTKIQGDYIGDVFGIGGAIIPNMTMGLAKTAQEQDSTSDFQGIVGVGFEEGEAVFAQTGYKYRNMISMLKNTGAIASRAYSLWLNDKGKRKVNK
jgi:Eukaryotic aspartyl protease